MQPQGSGEEGPWQKEVVKAAVWLREVQGLEGGGIEAAAGGACCEEESIDKGDVDGGLLLLTNL